MSDEEENSYEEPSEESSESEESRELSDSDSDRERERSASPERSSSERGSVHSSNGDEHYVAAGYGGNGAQEHGGSGIGLLGGLIKNFAKMSSKDQQKQDERAGGAIPGYQNNSGGNQQSYQGQGGQDYGQQFDERYAYSGPHGYNNQQTYGGHVGGYGGYENRAQQGHGGYAPSSVPPQLQYYGPSTQDAKGNIVQHSFQWSRCTGKKKALLIGINYFGQNGELSGCINDAHNVGNFIIERFGYQPQDIVMLLDDSTNPREIPTRANIIKAMQWLVRDAQPDDSLVIHYSGHGASVEDTDGDEHDGSDEAICPVDYAEAGMIVDDEPDGLHAVHEILVKPLVAGVRLLAIFDSCHSGTVLDLPFVYNTKGAIKEPDLINENEILKAGLSYLKGDSGSAFSAFTSIAKNAFGAHRSHQKTLKTRTSPADCILFSGCKDAQTSADTTEAGKATGAMSWAFIKSLTENHNQSYQELLNSVRTLLEAQYRQTVQISSSHPMDMSLQFVA